MFSRNDMSLCKYSSFQTMQKVYDFEKRCNKTVCRFLPVYYRDKRPQIDETTCRSSKGHVISEKDTY